jgi:DNA-binding PadR family transcriptional regulator
MKRGKGSAGMDGAVSVGGLVILSLILEVPRSGYDLVKEFERQAVSDWAQISKAHVYHLLRQLEMAGFVRSGSPEGDRNRSVFEITESGLQVLVKQLSAPYWLNDLSPSNFMTWLGLAVHAPQESLLGTLERRREWLVTQVEAKKSVLPYVEEYPSARAPFGVRLIELYLKQLRAELEWIEEEIARQRTESSLLEVECSVANQ